MGDMREPRNDVLNVKLLAIFTHGVYPKNCARKSNSFNRNRIVLCFKCNKHLFGKRF